MPLLFHLRSGVFYLNKELVQTLLRYQICRSKFISVHDQSPLITVISHLAGNHLNWHADFDGRVVHIGQLGSDHGAFVQFNEGNCIWRGAIESAGCLINCRIGIYFALAAECIELSGFIAAVWADVAWGENFIVAMGADFADQPIALLLKSPMSWNFHDNFLSASVILFIPTLKDSQSSLLSELLMRFICS